ncbi:hypothetical protein CS053_10825 [Rhodanobacter glycinis]|uniref:Uncharacterized protein n=1 Tax=Rhodanobacter glycinis TaxID=582702 RepID=A0A5B9E1T7_9GAMM|nr:hypothetical protein [Rhodanobacter glycinis]QEE24935.1 hypothetical protein CS053_10825 [Rhodanobacter glycinis]
MPGVKRLDDRKVYESVHAVNPAHFTIHSAVHAVREDILMCAARPLDQPARSLSYSRAHNLRCWIDSFRGIQIEELLPSSTLVHGWLVRGHSWSADGCVIPPPFLISDD